MKSKNLNWFDSVFLMTLGASDDELAEIRKYIKESQVLEYQRHIKNVETNVSEVKNRKRGRK